jgi:hypothetical protein
MMKRRKKTAKKKTRKGCAPGGAFTVRVHRNRRGRFCRA